MCLISIAPKGTEKLSDEFLESIRSGAYTNDDGSGYMVKYNGDSRVFISKGFFDMEALIKELREKNLTKDDELVVHSRSATSGRTDKWNTHPFVISNVHEDIILLEGFTDNAVLAHNGIFSQFSFKDTGFSDTYHFVDQLMSIPELLALAKRDKDAFEYILSDYMSWNKLAILCPDRDLLLLGTFMTDNGYIYSNKGYKCTNYRNVGGVETVIEKKNTFSTKIPKDDLKDEPVVECGLFETSKILTEGVVLNKKSATNSNKGRVISINSGSKIPTSPISRARVHREQDIKIPLTKHNFTEVLVILNKELRGLSEGSILVIEDFDPETLLTGVRVFRSNEIIHLPTTELMRDSTVISRQMYAKKYADYKRIADVLNPSKSSIKKLKKRIDKGYNREEISIPHVGSVMRTAAVLFFQENESYLTRKLKFEKEEAEERDVPMD